MPLELHPCTPEDMHALTEIQFSAFDSGITGLLHPAVTSMTITDFANKHKICMANEPDCHYLKVIDTELPADLQIIACAKWRINEIERGEEEVRKMLPDAESEKEGSAKRQFFEYLRDGRQTYMGGRPFYFLHMLITAPAHHRRGAGSLLLSWGLTRADAAHLPTYLEASIIGRPLYERFGFKLVKEVVFDLTKWGLEGEDRNAVMIRDARGVRSGEASLAK
ncbi:hypothetical protein BCR34DRAFT_326561 [Clohesyomyces aquaticus]|uniref:N-acetyltransferase domain-containing protein n=1 Tax=Clohesyomyces aquaticus TaxID=1231657 RepID=A0A1Y1ZMF1_9PLEO|nr:hypothetical protein BCR34DRAFT_326561 [Clohesyomyces aquaticus]